MSTRDVLGVRLPLRVLYLHFGDAASRSSVDEFWSNSESSVLRRAYSLWWSYCCWAALPFLAEVCLRIR